MMTEHPILAISSQHSCAVHEHWSPKPVTFVTLACRDKQRHPLVISLGIPVQFAHALKGQSHPNHKPASSDL